MLRVVNYHFSFAKKIAIVFLSVYTFSLTYSQSWQPLGSGMDNHVRALSEFSGFLYAGGFFQNAGGENVNSIAEWNESINLWRPMGQGVDTVPAGQVLALVETGINTPFSSLYAGGTFDRAGGDTAGKNIAEWNGTTWLPVGSGLDGNVNAIVGYSGSQLIVGGGFTSARFGVPARYIARWNGGAWDSLPGGVFSDVVITLVNYNGSIIAGGAFTNIGGAAMNYIAQWNGAYWTPLAGGMDNLVESLTIYDGELIAGGLFTHAGGVSANHLAQWNGSSWGPVGAGLPVGGVSALTVFHDNLIAATSGGSSYYIYKWDGNTWSPIGSGMNNSVYALCSSDFALIAGGQFTMAGGVTANHIAKWIEPGYVVKHKTAINKPIISQGDEIDSIWLYLFGGFHDVNSSLYVSDVNLTIDTITYPVDSDLELYLIHQSVTDTLVYQNGANGSNFRGTTLNDSASSSISNGTAPFTGSFRPIKPLSQFNNLDPTGPWILKVYDKGTGHTGTLEAWSLDITYGVNPIGIKPISSEVPNSFNLIQNYPNPFNPSTKINFALPKDAFAKIIIYDILGREVATLLNEQLKAGTYQADWNASNYSSGIYFYRLETDGYIETKKMVLVK